MFQQRRTDENSNDIPQGKDCQPEAKPDVAETSAHKQPESDTGNRRTISRRNEI